MWGVTQQAVEWNLGELGIGEVIKAGLRSPRQGTGEEAGVLGAVVLEARQVESFEGAEHLAEHDAAAGEDGRFELVAAVTSANGFFDVDAVIRQVVPW